MCGMGVWDGKGKEVLLGRLYDQRRLFTDQTWVGLVHKVLEVAMYLPACLSRTLDLGLGWRLVVTYC